MKRLIEVGFRKAGQWVIGSKGGPQVILTRFEKSKDLLYCFTIDNKPVYVATGIAPLEEVMLGHISDVRGLLGRIKAALQAGSVVDIYVLPDNGYLKMGEFTVNLAGALSKSIVETVRPEWNIPQK